VEGVVETEFVRPILSGESLLPYRVEDSLLGVVPCYSDRLLNPVDIELYPSLQQWWRQAEELWVANRSSERLSLMEQLNYQSKLSKQLPVAPFRVIYNKSGMHLTAAKLRDSRALISNGLYWASFYDEDEADFLCAIMNSAVTTEFLRPFMSYGKDERDIHKHVWQLPIPAYDPSEDAHRELAVLGAALSAIASAAETEPTLHFSAKRRRLRRLIEASPEGERVSEIVFEMLS
jgi:hypothetical protein